MAKFLSTDWKVVVAGTDLSRFADSVDTPMEKDQVDVSGFGGTREFIPGIEDATITIEFLQGFGTNEPHTVLYPLYNSGTTFVMYVQPFRAQGTEVREAAEAEAERIASFLGGEMRLNWAAAPT